MEKTSLGRARSFSKFDRCLLDWAAFEEAATGSKPHWFRDLLSLWRPSGHDSGKAGLRLAIRNNYLNFYRRGQSVARVACVSGELVADVHYKYVLGNQGEHAGPLYLRMNGQGVFSGGTSIPAYKDISTLLQWIAVAGGDEYAGVEKSIVDELVEKNDHVIDLEMAIPAWARSKVAVRMDLVAIEAGKVVFWEVKTVDDSRIRCRADFKRDVSPHVLKQLANYRDFLRADAHDEQVGRAYSNAARLLIRFRKIADEIGPKLVLGPGIIAAAQVERLAVAGLAALVVVDLKDTPEGPAWKSWKAGHESKLQGRIPMVVLKGSERLSFADLAFPEEHS